ncbi:MAG: DUF4091 domain-containing protein [Spirochaetales bacterium]|nr:DUF4091 domain-containing protein [Spirochaetales bacterium]
MIKKLISICLTCFIFFSCQTKEDDSLALQQAHSEAWANSNFGLEAYIYDSTHNFDRYASPFEHKTEKNYKTAWKGETISFTTAIFSSYDLENVKLSISDISSGSKIDKQSMQILVADYTKAYSNMYADPLFPKETADLAAARITPVWIKIKLPANTAARSYKLKFSATAEFDSQTLTKEIELELEVKDYTLPSPDKWGFTLDLWQNPYAVARYFDVEPWSDKHIELLRPYLEILADAGQKQITASIIDKPWGGQTYDPFHSMIKWTKKRDGSFEFDYTHFDIWVTMAKSAGLTGMINCYTMIPWHETFMFFDEAKNKNVTLKTKPGTTDFENLWRPFLNSFEAHLKEKGWLDHTNIAMDERPEALMDKVVSFLHKEAPGLGISSAYNYIPKISNDIKDFSISIEHTNILPEEWKQERNDKGFVTTFYVCTNPKKPNTFTISKPAEAHWLAIHAFNLNLTGILRWAFNSWPEAPFTTSDFGNWPPGDTYLVYPGAITSIRFEKFRDGIEDYERLKLLERDYPDKFAKINESVNKFNYTRDVSTVIENLNSYLDALDNL